MADNRACDYSDGAVDGQDGRGQKLSTRRVDVEAILQHVAEDRNDVAI